METVIGICDKCSGIVVRNQTRQGVSSFCKNCGSLPEIKVEKIIREDIVSDRTLLISTPINGNVICE